MITISNLSISKVIKCWANVEPTVGHMLGQHHLPMMANQMPTLAQQLITIWAVLKHKFRYYGQIFKIFLLSNAQIVINCWANVGIWLAIIGK
jgi:hypothetical protein